MPFQGLNKIII